MQTLFRTIKLARRAFVAPVYLVVPLTLIVFSLSATYYFLLDYVFGNFLASRPFTFLPQFITLLFAAFLLLHLYFHLSNSRRPLYSDSFFFVLLTALLFVIHPRSFTYDTGLYHAPFVHHLSSLGLEWNLAWLHSRYAFFNIFLFGQALVSKAFYGLHLLPSFNSLLLTSTLTYFYSLLKRTSVNLLPPLVFIGGMLIVPSESSESFHSYNSDFALALFIFSLSIFLLYDSCDSFSISIFSLIFLFVPLIKLSGFTQSIILLPLMSHVCSFRRSYILRSLPYLLLFLALYLFPLFATSYITAGYLVYPLQSTGPLRTDAIPLTTVVQEVKNSTIAWARFAYSNQLHKLTGDAPLASWFPGWSSSLNGRRMISFSLLSYLSLLPKNFLSHKSVLSFSEILVVLPLSFYWILAIFVLPPDPRFYLGPTLLSIFFFIKSFNFTFFAPPFSHKAFAVFIFSLAVFTSIWRTSDFNGLDHPDVQVTPTDASKFLPYIPHDRTLPINTPTNSDVCWTAPSPCR